jgi:hypothetical protein
MERDYAAIKSKLIIPVVLESQPEIPFELGDVLWTLFRSEQRPHALDYRKVRVRQVELGEKPRFSFTTESQIIPWNTHSYTCAGDG